MDGIDYAIQAEDLQKKYGNKVAIKELNLQLHKDQIIGLIGANGSGKTSFLKMCAGLEEVTSGSLRVLGGEPWRDIAVHSEIIYSMHDLPVAQPEKLKTILKYYDIAFPHFDLEFAEKMAALFELPLKRTVSRLSQGMKSLFHFVCAMATRSQVTLLDEPFIGIDIEKRRMAYEILLRDYMEYSRTFVISSHNLQELEGVLSELVLIHDGELIFYQEMDMVREMLCCVQGNTEQILAFSGKLSQDQIVRHESGELGDRLIVRGSAGQDWAREAKQAGLEISAVAPEDVCVYLTSSDREGELDGLWENTERRQ